MNTTELNKKRQQRFEYLLNEISLLNKELYKQEQKLLALCKKNSAIIHHNGEVTQEIWDKTTENNFWVFSFTKTRYFAGNLDAFGHTYVLFARLISPWLEYQSLMEELDIFVNNNFEKTEEVLVKSFSYGGLHAKEEQDFLKEKYMRIGQVGADDGFYSLFLERKLAESLSLYPFTV